MGEKEERIIRAVLDTNTFISSMLFEGVTNQLVDYWQKGKFIYLISRPILEEYLRVLSYPKFGLSETQIKQLLEEELLPYVEVVECTSVLSVVEDDPFDNMFLSTALDGKASFIVSGDRHLLNIGQYENIGIVRIKDFIKLIK